MHNMQSLYFFDFFLQPPKLALCVNFFRDVRNLVSDQIFDGVLVYLIFFSSSYKMFPSVMWAMLRVQF